MLSRFGVLLVFALLCGCSSVETVATNDEDSSLREVNKAVRGQIVRLELQSGERMTVTSVRVAPDKVTWLDPRSNTLRSEPTTNVREISVRKAGRGALMGLAAGVVAGAAFGGVRAVVEGDDPGNDPLAITRAEKLRVFPPAHAVYASLITTPIGAILGAKKSYRFEHEPEGPAPVTHR